MPVVPCSLCGYDAPAATCPHCGLAAEGLGRARSRHLRAVLDGALAVPKGLALLATTPRVKRWLIPPFVLTSLVFLGLFLLALSWIDGLVESYVGESAQRLPEDALWITEAVIGLLNSAAAAWASKLLGVLAALVAGSLVALYTFSIAYEAIAGPFLDEIQGRMETRWFGDDPRNRLQRPTEIPVARCVRLTLLASAPALALLGASFPVPGALGWALLAATPLPFVVAGVIDREYGTWLRWVAKVEGATLWVSVKASLVSLAVLLLFFPLKFFFAPIGYVLFFAIAGFATAITLLDIPFSRRQWPLRDRLRFVFGNLAPMTAYGTVASLVFLVPVIGPVVMVPAASIGGLWLVCRLDKSGLRPAEVREMRAGGPESAVD